MIAQNSAKREYSNGNVHRAGWLGDQSRRLPKRSTSFPAKLYFNQWASRPSRWLSFCGELIVTAYSTCLKQPIPDYLVSLLIHQTRHKYTDNSVATIEAAAALGWCCFVAVIV